jgi:pyruvate dehydrogenase E2 component (dihydrolipoamide acetyltransferase)
MSDPAQIAMPQLSDSMQEGTILRWLIADGERVARGQELVEIETDKASMTYESELDGVLQIVVAEGETVAVGAPIAHVGEGGAGAQAESAAATEPSGEPVELARPAEAERAAASPVQATPLARRVARVHGVSLAGLSGSGPRGRVLQADALRAAGVAVRASSPPETPSVSPVPAATVKGDTRRLEPTRTQRLIARRMAEAKATIPEFQVQAEVAMDASLAFRGESKRILEAEAPTLNDLIVKACALSLRGHPRANGSYVDGGFELHERVNVGIAVAAEQALIVPVVQDADAKALGEIARESRRLAERVRLGTVTPPELSGATFTVSNLGMYGMSAIVPVINPPQAAILGVGALREVLVREAGEVVERRLLTLTLSCDHRILYGADAALFLAEVKGLLESPLGLVL